MDQLTVRTAPSVITAKSPQNVPSTRALSGNDLAFQPAGFPFMDLPKELRLMVYDIVATHSIRRPLLTHQHSLYYDVPDVGLLRTSRWVRDEAFTILQRGEQAIPTFTVHRSRCNNWFNMEEALKNATCVLARLRLEKCASCHEKDDKLVSCPRVYTHPTMTETAVIDFVNHPLPHLVCTESTINRFYHRTFATLRKGKPLHLRVVLPPPEHRYTYLTRREFSSFIYNMADRWDVFGGQQMKLVNLKFLVHPNSAERWAGNLSAPGMSPARLSSGTWLVTYPLWGPSFVTLEMVETADSF